MNSIKVLLKGKRWADAEEAIRLTSSDDIQQEPELLHEALDKTTPTSIIRLLLKKGLCPNHRQQDGFSAVYLAACRNVSLEVMHMLLDHNGDPNMPTNNEGMFTPIQVAVDSKASPYLIKLLLERGADPNRPASDGATAVHIAASEKASPFVMRLLLSYGGNPNATTKGGVIPMCLAAKDPDSFALMSLLLNFGGDPNIEMGDGRTPLHIAVVENDAGMDMVRLLLERGGDPNRMSQSGETPLTAAQRLSKLDIVELLLQNSTQNEMSFGYRGSELDGLLSCWAPLPIPPRFSDRCLTGLLPRYNGFIAAARNLKIAMTNHSNSVQAATSDFEWECQQKLGNDASTQSISLERIYELLQELRKTQLGVPLGVPLEFEHMEIAKKRNRIRREIVCVYELIKMRPTVPEEVFRTRERLEEAISEYSTELHLCREFLRKEHVVSASDEVDITKLQSQIRNDISKIQCITTTNINNQTRLVEHFEKLLETFLVRITNVNADEQQARQFFIESVGKLSNFEKDLRDAPTVWPDAINETVEHLTTLLDYEARIQELVETRIQELAESSKLLESFIQKRCFEQSCELDREMRNLCRVQDPISRAWYFAFPESYYHVRNAMRERAELWFMSDNLEMVLQIDETRNVEANFENLPPRMKEVLAMSHGHSVRGSVVNGRPVVRKQFVSEWDNKLVLEVYNRHHKLRNSNNIMNSDVILQCDVVVVENHRQSPDSLRLNWLQFPFMPGGNVQFWATERSRPICRKIDVMVKIAKTVQSFHSMSTFNLNIRPQNILMTSSDDEAEPRLTGFEFAEPHHLVATRDVFRCNLKTPGLTMAQMGRSSDIYALAVTVVHVLSYNPNPDLSRYISPDPVKALESSPLRDGVNMALYNHIHNIVSLQDSLSGDALDTLISLLETASFSDFSAPAPACSE